MALTTTKILIVQEDGTVVGEYFLGQGEHLIGREGSCSIRLESNHISRKHARLIISAEAIEIEDLNSSTGTYLDGVIVKGRIPIQPGQNLWISNLYIDIERQGYGGLVEGSRLAAGRFTLKRELGKGGMGAVWLALDEEAQENVALKLVFDGMGTDSMGLKDLQREVTKARQLEHPNIVQMGYCYKEEGEPAFISLEYVDGTDLQQLRCESPKGLLAWKTVQAYMLQLCDALEYAHSQGVAHRDIKPSNFMIDSKGNLKLADFGIAATLADTVATYTSNTVLGSGTPPYMSPQQLDGERPQVTDDIYSVGATFYDLLTSKPPFYHGDIGYQVRHTAVTPMMERLKELNLENDIPEYVGAIVMACLQKDPTQRPQSMRVVREWIQSSEEARQAPASSRETRVPATRKGSPGGIRKQLAYGIIAVMVAGMGGGLYLIIKIKRNALAKVEKLNKESQKEYKEYLERAKKREAAAKKAVAAKAAAAKAAAAKAAAAKAAAAKAAAAKAAATKAGTVLWSAETSGDVLSSPAIGADGTVYVGSRDIMVYALDGRNGARKWEFETGGPVSLSPTIGVDGTLYVGSDDHKLYAINPEGTLKWAIATGGSVRSSPAIGFDGTVYVGSIDKKVYALDGASGAKKWEFETGSSVFSSPAIGSDGTVYVGSLDSKVYALDGRNGAKKWEFITGAGVYSSPAIGSDGTVYVGSWDSKIYALDGASGAKKWEFETGEQVYSSPAIGSDGTVYVGSHNRKVYALDGESGVRKWEFETGHWVRSSPAIGSDGTVYVGSRDNKVYALDGRNGAKKWEYETGDMVHSGPAIGADGTLYVGSNDNKVYALKSTSKGPAKSPWPMFGQNPQHTGNVNKLNPPLPPLPIGRTKKWNINGGAPDTRIDLVYQLKDAATIKKDFGLPDLKKDTFWVYTKMKVRDVVGGRTMTEVHFGILNSQVFDIRAEP